MFIKQVVRQHSDMCLENPDVLKRLRALLSETADDGYIVPGEDYKALSRESRLPNVVTLRNHFGGWAGVAAWAGLKYSKGKRAGRKILRKSEPVQRAKWERLGATEPVTQEDRGHLQGLLARPAERVVRAWEIRSKRYVEVRVEKNWFMLV